jgi:hypothetical protein
MYYKQPFNDVTLYAKVYGQHKNGDFKAIIYDTKHKVSYGSYIENIALWIKCNEDDLPEKFRKALR